MDFQQSMTLQPISPKEAVELYIENRRGEVSDQSLQAYHYRLSHFIRWATRNNIENLNGLTGRDLQRYKNWRQGDGNLNPTSLKTQMDTLRVFIRFLEKIDGVEPNLSEKILSPTIGKEGARDEKLESDRADEILSYLSTFHYASLDHLIMGILWATGIRLGTLRAFDLGDFDKDRMWLSAVHRPDSETPLKNKEEGERYISLRPEACNLISDFISHTRPDVSDEYDRFPLVATENGRASGNFIRKTVYRLTCPEFIESGKSCHPSAPWECENCVSPHAIRRGSITHHLAKDVPEVVVSDRMNVSRETLDRHYDRRSEEVKVEQRREYLANI